MSNPEKIQRDIYQTMTPQRRLEIARQMYRTARQLKAAGLQLLHSDWTDEQIRNAVREIFLHART